MRATPDRGYAAIRRPIKEGAPAAAWQLNPVLIRAGKNHPKSSDELIIFRDQQGWWVYGSISAPLYRRHEASVSDFLDLLWKHQQNPWKAVSGVYALSFGEDGLVTRIRPAMPLFSLGERLEDSYMTSLDFFQPSETSNSEKIG